MGVKYADWRPLSSYVNLENGSAKAVLAEAPADVETARPYAFLYRSEPGAELVEILEGDMMLLGIAVAHEWANSDRLDGISDVEIAQLLVATAMPKVDEYFLGVAKNFAESHSQVLQQYAKQ